MLASAVLAGCQTLNEDQCSVTDWRVLGSTDGAAGRPQSYVSRHQEACTKFGIPVDVPTWNAGWNEGIRRYCTPENGISVGTRGSSYANSCPGDLAFSFREGYDLGRRVYSARSDRDRVQGELDEKIRAVAAATPEQRVSAQLAVDLKRNELFSAQNRLNDAERASDFFRLRLATAR
jgi:Protein of unknown function (DUF2799)